jgi:MFS family permease
MPDSSARKRLLLAFLVAPLAAPVAYILGAIVVGLIVRGAWMSARSLQDLFIGVFTLGGPTAYVAALVAGVPTYFLLRRLELVHRWTLWLAGAAIGAAGALVLAPYLRGDLFSIRFPWWVAALLGVASAEVFWRVRGEAYAEGSP